MESTPRIEVGRGQAEGGQARGAGRRAAEAAAEAIRAHPLSLVLVLAEARPDLSEVLRGVREVTGDAPLAGAALPAPAGADAGRGRVDVTLIASPELEAHVGAAGDVGRGWRAAVGAAVQAPGLAGWFHGAQRWLASAVAGRAAFGLLLTPTDPRRAPARNHHLVQELAARAGGRLPLFGGAPGGGGRDEPTWVFCGDRVLPDGLVLAVVETSLQFGVATAHGFRASDDRVVVTAASGDVVLALDGRPAAERYAELAWASGGAADARGAPALLATTDGFGEPIPLVAVHGPQRGGLRFTRPLPEGTVLRRLVVEDEPGARAGAVALRKAVLRGRVTEPALALIARDVLRGRLLGEAARADLAEVEQALGGAPVVDLPSSGEHGLGEAGASDHVHGAVSLLVIGAEPSREAQVAREREALRREAGERQAALLRAEARIRALEGQQRALLDGLVDWAWVRDADGRYLAVNAATAAGVGLDAAAMIGRTDVELRPPELAARIRAEDQEVMAHGRARRFEVETRTPDGQVRWLEVVKTPWRDGEGRVAGLAGIARDYTHFRELEQLRTRNEAELQRLVHERTRQLEELTADLAARVEQLRRADETLRESEEKYRALVRGTPGSAVFLFDGARRCALAEGALLGRLGLGHEALLEQLRRDPQGDRVGLLLGSALAGDTPEAVEVALEGEVVELRAAPVRPGGGEQRGAMLVVTDVTERRRLEDQIRQAQKMDAVGRLAGGVAHDFNNVLTVILGAARDLRRRAAEGELHELAGEVLEAAQRGAVLTRQLLAFSRQQPLEPREVDVNDVVRGMEGMLRRLIGEDVEVMTCLEPGLGTVLADHGQLEQVIMNLAVNARDAMPSGGRLMVSTRAVDMAPEDGMGAPRAPGPHVELSVTDTGHGMDRRVREHIFEPFFTTKEKGRGTGLGLATVFGIVRQSGGCLTLRSEPGAGTTFNVFLPRAVLPARPAEAPAPAPAAGRCEGRALLVEDDAGVRALMRRMLEAIGLDVVATGLPDEALRAAVAPGAGIDLLVADVVMPSMGGPELAARLLAERPGLRVLFVSGYADGGGLRASALPPGQRFLPKPFTDDAFARAVRDVLAAPVAAPSNPRSTA